MWKWKSSPNQFVELSVRGEVLFVGYQQQQDERGRVKTTLAIAGDPAIVKIRRTDVPAYEAIQFARSRAPQAPVMPPIERTLRRVPQVSVNPPGGER